MDDRSTVALDAWLGSLSRDSRRELYVLLDELVRYALRALPLGLDVSRDNRFGFLRLKMLAPRHLARMRSNPPAPGVPRRH